MSMILLVVAVHGFSQPVFNVSEDDHVDIPFQINPETNFDTQLVIFGTIKTTDAGSAS